MKARLGWTRWTVLLLLAGILGACGGAAVPKTTAAPAAPAPAQPADPAPAEPQATCDDLAIRLLDRGPGIHGAIVADTLHMGGATAPVTCAEPASQSVAGWSIPDDWTAQVRQSQYYIVIRYPGGSRLYVISLRSDGTTCVLDTNDECIARVSDLPEDFDLRDLPDEVAATIPGGREAPPADTVPDAAGNPQPRNEAIGVTVDAPLLRWSAAARATGYDLYWGTTKNLAADAALGTPLNTSYTVVTIRMPGATAAERRLAHETTYYWRVDAKNDAGTTRGNVWSFTTAAAPAAAAEPVAPAWPKAAQSFSWVDERAITPVAFTPTGTPTPTLSVTGSMPEGIELDLDTLRLDGTPRRRGHGSFTVTASNSAGTADTTVSWKVSCRHSDAEIETWLRGLGGWLPIFFDQEEDSWVLHSHYYYSRPRPHVYNRFMADRYMFSRLYRTTTGFQLVKGTGDITWYLQLPGGVRADDCQTIRGDGWLFGWEPSVEDFMSCSPPWMAHRHAMTDQSWRTNHPDFFLTVWNTWSPAACGWCMVNGRFIKIRAGTQYLLAYSTPPPPLAWIPRRC